MRPTVRRRIARCLARLVGSEFRRGGRPPAPLEPLEPRTLFSADVLAAGETVEARVELPDATVVAGERDELAIAVKGGAEIAGLDLAAEVNDGTSGPTIPAVDLESGTVFAGNHTGQTDNGSTPRRKFLSITTATGSVSADGRLATLTVDARGLTAGETFALALANVAGESTALSDATGRSVATSLLGGDGRATVEAIDPLVADEKAPRVEALTPRGARSEPVSDLTVRFGDGGGTGIDPAAATDPAHYELARSSQTGGAVPAIDDVTFDPAAQAATVKLATDLPAPETGETRYELWVDGVTDRAGNPLDGDADGEAGGRFTGEIAMVASFRVDRVSLEAAGLTIAFSEAPDPASLSIHGPAPDLVVTDGTGDRVSGSLIPLRADSATLAFVAPDPLAAETYRVTVRGGEDGVVAAAGRALDGDGDGSAGGDFSQALSASTAGERTLTLPGFARAGGQSVALPAAGAGLPIRIDDGAGLERISFELRHDPDLLGVSGASPGADLPDDFSVALAEPEAGRAAVAIRGPGPLPSGSAEIVTLEAAVPATAPGGARGLLEIADARGDGGAIALRGARAAELVALPGDADGDDGYSGLDASRVARAAVGLEPAFSSYPRIAPRVVGDVDADGRITGADASLIARQAVGLAPVEVPPLPADRTTEAVRPETRASHRASERAALLASAAGERFGFAPETDVDGPTPRRELDAAPFAALFADPGAGNRAIPAAGP